MANDAMQSAQADVFALLADPATHGVQTVERVETHVSVVFLAGERVYKVKKAVKLPFLDFVPPAAREAACRAEVALNRRTAASLYLGLYAVVKDGQGKLFLREDSGREDPGKADGVVEWVVAMRRFDQDMSLDRIAARGEMSRAFLEALSAHVAAFHEGAEIRRGQGGAAETRRVIEEIGVSLRRFAGVPFDAGASERLIARTLEECGRQTALIERRREDGMVRCAHGDMHMRNICVLDGEPMLFDCIEFNEAFAVIDVLYDLAFLLMDLRHGGHRREAALVLNRYLEARADLDGLPLLPLFLSMRAQIRAFIAADVAGHAADPAPMRAEAMRYFAEAEGYLEPRPAALIAVGGFSGAGKSRCARAVASALGAPPGAVVFRSDAIRKKAAGRALNEKLAPEHYGAEMTARTYRILCESARKALQGGRAAIADAVFARPEQREAIEAVARDLGVPFVGLWLEARPEVAVQRIEGRVDNISDATVEVLHRQLASDPGAIDWIRFDSSGPRDVTAAAVQERLSRVLPRGAVS